MYPNIAIDSSPMATTYKNIYSKKRAKPIKEK